MADLDAVQTAMQKPEAELLREWYDALTVQAFGASSGDLLSATGDLRDPFFGWLDREGLCDLICRDWSYCTRRLQFENPTFLAAAIADLLLGAGGIAAPVNVAVLLVKFSCDHLCRCDERTA